ncbi:MAG: hypothetical protein CVU13_09050 [Bacteroidetes bacterium HGW-Bacteroidetes-8]|jgi:flagellar basal body-associated protein FliL|nr:MAG: hypothetical protein CVU13_09050 [Bacteroidetes bacterium HGW-Bacteroidetes-8]
MKISVKSRLITILIVVTAAVVTVALVFYSVVRQKSDRSEQGDPTEFLSAIPVDAAAIFVFNSFENLHRTISLNNPLFGDLLFKNTPLKNLTNSLYELCSDETMQSLKAGGCAISLHYSAKDKISPLLVIDFNSADISKILNALNTKKRAGSKRMFSGKKVEKWESVEFTIVDNKIIASDSPIILESSLRHLASGASIMDTEDFKELLSGREKLNAALFLNHSQSGKLFSGFAGRDYLKYADFTSRFTGWSSMQISTASDNLTLDGEVVNSKGYANYATAFFDLNGSQTSVMSVLPSETFSLLTFTIEDLSKYIRNFTRYNEFYKKRDAKALADAERWFLSYNPRELSCALVSYGGVLEWITIVRKDKPWYNFLETFLIKGQQPEKPVDFKNRGSLTLLFGSIFSNTPEESILVQDEWIYIGKSALLEEISQGAFKRFTMQDWLIQTKAYNLLNTKDCMLSLVVNGSQVPDSLLRFFRDDIKNDLRRTVKKSNVLVTAFQLNKNKERGVYLNIFAYADSTQIPAPRIESSGSKPSGWKSDTLITIPKGPYEVINFNNREKEYLVQLPNYALRLCDTKMEGLWAIPFSSPLCGYVRQVDFFKNGKLQMLFASGNKLYLLDRLGRFVAPYPKSVTDEVTLGPQVYDIKGDGDFAIMLLHKDNTLRLYDRTAGVYPRWNNISVEERIKSFPELIVSGENRYWVLRTSLRTMIYSINGTPVANFTGEMRLANNTPVKPDRQGVVTVKTASGKNISVDLETGNIKRSK